MLDQSNLWQALQTFRQQRMQNRPHPFLDKLQQRFPNGQSPQNPPRQPIPNPGPLAPGVGDPVPNMPRIPSPSSGGYDSSGINPGGGFGGHTSPVYQKLNPANGGVPVGSTGGATSIAGMPGTQNKWRAV